MEFKDRLKQLRTQRGLSQQALADAIFVSRSAVAKWEAGLGLPNPDSMQALAAFFAVSEDFLKTPEPENMIVEKNRTIHIQSNTILALALIAVVLIGLFVSLYLNGQFSIIGKTKSPNGNIRSTIYSGSRECLWLDDSFTIITTGEFCATHIYLNAEFFGLYWSANSQYQLLELNQDGMDLYWLADYRNNIEINLIHLLDRGVHEIPEFQKAPWSEKFGNREIDWKFLYWDKYDPIICFQFSFQTTAGPFQGKLWYDLRTDLVTDVRFERYA